MLNTPENMTAQWTMWGVIGAVGVQFAIGLVFHGMILQRVQDLKERVARIEDRLDRALNGAAPSSAPAAEAE